MTLKSKFTFRAYLLTIIAVFFFYTLLDRTKSFYDRGDVPVLVIISFESLLIFTLIWLIYGELRTKAIKVEIFDGKISVRRYLGLGIRKVYLISEFDGFETALLPSRIGPEEYLYLTINQKKIVKLSHSYHKNYRELKANLSENCNDLGFNPFKMSQEIKEIFI